MATNRRAVQRRMEYLMAEGYGPSNMNYDELYAQAQIAIATGVTYNECMDSPYEPMDYKKHGYIRSPLQVMILAIELGWSADVVKKRWFEIYQERREARNAMKGSPQKEGRDNKGTYVGGGGSNRNKIRYPKKNRSKKVWAMFYKMFPWAAERDNWDGEKSDRYPKKK